MTPEQHPAELDWLLKQIKGSTSILEVGSRAGAMLERMAAVCAPSARICSIDIGCGDDMQTADALKHSIAALRERGYAAEVLIADSTAKEAIEWAAARAPFDFVFIDGDHSLEGVMADWNNYGGMAKRIGFHDIIRPQLEVKKLWQELRATHTTCQVCGVHSRMGIGIVYND